MGKSRRGERQGLWRFAVSAAAVVVIWLNLSMSAVNNMDWDFGRPDNGKKIRVVAAQIREVLPEISEQKAFRHALLLRAGSELVMVPRLKRPGKSMPARAKILED